jgi:hypothetical protein
MRSRHAAADEGVAEVHSRGVRRSCKARENALPPSGSVTMRTSVIAGAS